jgi:hypothetical protein
MKQHKNMLMKPVTYDIIQKPEFYMNNTLWKNYF